MRIDISKLTLTNELQPRQAISSDVVTEYADAMREGVKFPPVLVFFDGQRYLLADGFHRVYAAREAKLVSIEADVKNGDEDAAKWHSYSANSSHGLRRTNADKRRAVEHALAHPHAEKMSDSAIARHVGVSQQFVSKMRSVDTAVQPIIQRLYDDPPPYDRLSESAPIKPIIREVTRNGSTFLQNVGNIGKGGIVTAPPERTAPTQPSVYTLGEWTSKPEAERNKLISDGIAADTTSRFNSQETDNIEWARWSWNPVTGCKHNCIYCYARDIANRFYPHGFEPAIIPARLAIPRVMKPPPEAEHAIGYKNVFTCSMADLFGQWVPQEWIDAVFNVVTDAPQWNFLFLTKFPLRMARQNWPANAWVGTSVDSQARVNAAEEAFSKVKAGIRWLSCEPLLEPVKFKSLAMFDWIVIGGQTKSSQAPEFQPNWEWIESLVFQARKANCKVYFKTNLHARPSEYPQS